MRYWTTADQEPGEQFSYWREVMCEAFTPLSVQREDDHIASGPPEVGLASWVRSSVLTSTNCAEVSSRTQTISHGDAEVRRTDTDYVFLNLQVRGHCVVSQGGRTCVVPSGAFSFVDTTSTYEQNYVEDPVHREWRVVSFRIPRASLVPQLADPQSFTAVTHDAERGGLAGIARSTILSTWSNVDRLDRSEADAAESALNAVLAAVAGGGDALRDTGRERLDAALRASVNRYLAANLRGRADLSASAVARRFNVSVRKLHSVYEGTGNSYGRTLTELRIEGCSRDLRVGPAGGSLTEVATRWGFYDLSHLNRVFRTHRGCLPSEYRSAGFEELAS